MLRIATAIAMLLIIGPIVIVLVVAFSSGENLSFPPVGFSLRWFQEFFATSSMRRAFLFSLVLAIVAATSATVLGLMAAVYVSRRRGWHSALLQPLFVAPMVFPAIILGMALLLLYKSVHMAILPGLLLAHIVICLPYAFRSVLGSLLAFDITLEEAAQSLGASPLVSFLRITLPIVWPGVFSGWLFAFIVSFGELNTAIFLTGPGWVTLPIEIFSYLQFEGGQLVVAAASALQVFVILAILLAAGQIIGAKRIVGS